MADAEQASRPAGDERPRELVKYQAERIALADALHDAECECGDRPAHEAETGVNYSTVAQTVVTQGWAPIAAHVGQRDDGAAGDDTATPAGGLRALFEHVGIDTAGKDITVAGRVVDPAPASPTVFRADDGREWRSDYAAAGPRAGDTAPPAERPTRWLVKSDADSILGSFASRAEAEEAWDRVSDAYPTAYVAPAADTARPAAAPEWRDVSGLRKWATYGADVDLRVNAASVVRMLNGAPQQPTADAEQAGDGIDPTIAAGYRLEDIRGYSPRDLGFGADGTQAGGERDA